MVENVTNTVNSALPEGYSTKAGDVVTLGGPGGTAYTKQEDGTWQPSTSTEAKAAGGGNPASSTSDTPPQWSEVEDARKLPGAGKYPNYWSHKTRSGHLIMMDDSKGAESITIQHRGGSMVQFLPDGKVRFRSQNGKHDVVFGEHRMYISGAYDITVDGAASLTCKKDYNITAKNINVTASEDINFKSKNLNFNATGAISTTAASMTTKVEGSIETTAQGKFSASSLFGMTLGSIGDSVVVYGQKDVGIGAKGRLAMEGLTASLIGVTTVAIKSTAKTSLSSVTSVAIDGPTSIRIQEGASDIPTSPRELVLVPPPVTPTLAEITNPASAYG